MREVLIRIKRAVLAGNIVFTIKAEVEMEADRLLRGDVVESILMCNSIYKTIRSTSSVRRQRREYLYVIRGANAEGTMIYSKGKLIVRGGVETYYVLISAKRTV